MKTIIAALSVLALTAGAFVPSASAYDGTVCKEPGNCWEPKPGYPEKVAGSEYDPQHDPMEVNKQGESIKGMEERNKTRVEHFAKTGDFVFDVAKIPK